MDTKQIELKTDRFYRNFDIVLRDAENADSKIIEGYAVKFNDPTVLYEYDGVQYKEVVDRNAFNGVDLSNVVLNFNHGGKPVARTKNGTLTLTVDNVGLSVRADLSGTEDGRALFEEVKGGYLDKMSFAFTTENNNAEYMRYDKATHTTTILKVKRLYDTAVVDFPAYENTSVFARNFYRAVADVEVAAVAAQKAETELRQKLILKIKSKL